VNFALCERFILLGITTADGKPVLGRLGVGEHALRAPRGVIKSIVLLLAEYIYFECPLTLLFIFDEIAGEIASSLVQSSAVNDVGRDVLFLLYMHGYIISARRMYLIISYFNI